MRGNKKHIAYTEFQATSFSLDFAAVFEHMASGWF